MFSGDSTALLADFSGADSYAKKTPNSSSFGSESGADLVVNSVSTSIDMFAKPLPSPQSPSRATLDSPPVDRERREDLENQYIPVGILRKYELGLLMEDQPAELYKFPEAELATLQAHWWIRTQWHSYDTHPGWSYVRISVLPDDKGHNFIPRTRTSLRRALRVVMSRIDKSRAAWDGKFETEMAQHDPHASDDESLWYIFNTLNDPKPSVGDIKDPYGRQAMQELLCSSRECDANIRESSNVRGLRTVLHPYQSRSAATMIQREVQPRQMLDPRLQACRSVSDQEYFYDKEEGIIVHEKRLYSEACGGILAETMGCGKTLICLSVILATRGHFPRIPTEYQETNNPIRKTTGTLMEMAAATAGRFSIPWGSHFQQLNEAGMSFDRCVRVCEQNRGAYLIPPPPSRYQSREGSRSRPPPTRIGVSSGTLIIVPPNLVDHWKSEIATHTEGLNVLILQTRDDKTPSEEEILRYDIILFSRTRFEKEAGEPENNRRSSASQMKESPLKKFHWLRIIVDEGHNVAGHGHKTSAVHMLDQLRVERRWVVSGTPSNGLYGVEVSIASQETLTTDTEPPDNAASSMLRSRKKTGSAVEEELKDLDKLRYIVVEFLKLQPWSNSRAHDPANWPKYIKPLGEDGKRRKAPSLRAVLQGLVVRHRLDVINSELPLPALHNKVVSLEPTFYDKLSINIFLFNLTVNAITSERKDQDYMFQSRNRKHLSLTLNNLRQAGFWWTGFDRKDLETTVDVAEKYLEKNMEKMTTEDRQLLSEGLHIAQKALNCKSFQAFCNFDELGVYVTNFPEHARGLWALTPHEDELAPLLLGISQARIAQKFVTSHLIAEDPAEGLAGAGIMARRKISERAEKKPTRNTNEAGAGDNLTHKHKPEKADQKSPKKTFSQGLTKRLPVESPLSRATLVATTSVKLTYLLDRVQALHKTEKIIIFYENNNSAFWIAEGLEMLGIDFRIYANTLKTSQKAAYLSLFEESETVRILLMDLRQASHGLHIASASRVFIVNPIWRPNVESQAIKRAHRIGQKKPVFVETLVLKDTLEEKMLRRRQQMSNAELQHAEKDMLEDSTMSSIIQRERFYPLPDDEESVKPAYLHKACGFFDRHELPLPDNYHEGLQASTQQGSLLPTKRKQHVPSFDIPWVDSDVSPASNYSPKKRKVVPSSPKLQIVTERGIVMTPPSSSRSLKTFASPTSISVNRGCNAEGSPQTSSLFGG